MEGFYITSNDNLVCFAKEDGSVRMWCLHIIGSEVSITPACVMELSTSLRECPYFKDNEHPTYKELQVLEMLDLREQHNQPLTSGILCFLHRMNWMFHRWWNQSCTDKWKVFLNI